MTCRHSCRNMQIFTECVWMCEYGIGYELRWEVAHVRDFLYWALFTSPWDSFKAVSTKKVELWPGEVFL